ncbi:hypothetical protein RHGRI_036556 [Rhododendron griersonianum]|uniref:Uncharacterized protein n=1 Tax=Rhododendron griersonianum TaxID=479676 RepID=A0AAV6HNF6_9ERIC|nr:hypothetical protein RHGRI_036556 [Rhododendron griersonianum]
MNQSLLLLDIICYGLPCAFLAYRYGDRFYQQWKQEQERGREDDQAVSVAALLSVMAAAVLACCLTAGLICNGSIWLLRCAVMPGSQQTALLLCCSHSVLLPMRLLLITTVMVVVNECYEDSFCG